MELDLDRPLEKLNTVGFITLCLSCEGLISSDSIHGFQVKWSFDDGWVAQPGSFFEEDQDNCDCDTPMPYCCVLTYDGNHHWAGHDEYESFQNLVKNRSR